MALELRAILLVPCYLPPAPHLLAKQPDAPHARLLLAHATHVELEEEGADASPPVPAVHAY